MGGAHEIFVFLKFKKGYSINEGLMNFKKKNGNGTCPLAGGRPNKYFFKWFMNADF